MRALTLGLALGLAVPGVPARSSPDAVRARATADLGPVRLDVAARLDGGPVIRAVAIVDDGALHLAVRRPFGPPAAILRAAHGQVGLELVGDREVVASDAGLALGLLGVTTDDLGRLLRGWPPQDLGPLIAVSGGYAGFAGATSVLLDPDGRLVAADVPCGACAGGRVRARRAGGRLTLSDGATSLALDAGPSEPVRPPASAFLVGRASVPVVAAERLAPAESIVRRGVPAKGLPETPDVRAR